MAQSGFCGSSSLYHAVDNGRYEHFDKARFLLDHFQHVQIAGQRDVHFLIAAQYLGHPGLAQVAVDIAVELLECFGVCAEQDVTIAEAQLLGLCVELETMGEVLHGDIALAPSEQHSRVDNKSQHEVDQHATNHDEEALPSRFCPELPRLYRLLHLLHVHRLVDHAGYLDIASQWQPAYAVGGVAVLRFELKRSEPRVEEKAELFYPYLEEFGKQEMPSFMQQDEQGKTENELKGSDKEYFHQ